MSRVRVTKKEEEVLYINYDFFFIVGLFFLLKINIHVKNFSLAFVHIILSYFAFHIMHESIFFKT